MLFRETMFLILGLPALVYGVKAILGLRRPKIAAGRIFLRGELFTAFLRSILHFVGLTVAVAVFLYLWWATGIDIFRIVGGCFCIASVGMLLLALYKLNLLLGG